MTVYATNTKARHTYTILETWEAGIALTGAEVKSVRAKHLSLAEAYAVVSVHPRTKQPQVSLLNCHITAYPPSGTRNTPDPRRSRTLLLHRREAATILGKIQQSGLTIIPLRVYAKGAQIKVELGLARGKKLFDKREQIKARDLERDVRRTLKGRR